ncbi:MAG: hypothetical protein ETSY1_05535 [Candidatus Entotheonella factor]|uniref:Glycosyltransferase subfamily 4-like N-terminal domain-containing protein n=1 Tax=Entotheonella factor TaxID=1429438 RepID=W4LV34_ENTF1|nr:MAG: hypothetical protein ETSY1_05535 [Candidatus Entotheonella factor]
MKTVLMIAYYFPPSGVSGIYRTMRFLKFLPECSWRPVVLTLQPDAYEAGEPRDDSWLERLPADLTVIRTTEFRVLEGLQWLRGRRGQAPAVPASAQAAPRLHERREAATSWWQRCKDAVTGMLSTPDRQIGWWPPAVWAGWQAVRDHGVSVLYSTGKPWTTHLVGYGLRRLTQTPWVADFRDPWLNNPSSAPMSRLRQAMEARLERLVMRWADVVVANTEVVRQEWLQRYPFLKPDKAVTITNGFDPDEALSHRLPLAPRCSSRAPRLTLTHAGSLYAQRYPHHFFVALDRILTRGAVPQDRLQVNLVGSWDTQTSAFLAVHPKVAEVVQLVSQVPHHVYLDYLQQSDVLLLLQPQTASQIPAKVFEYMQAGKPILALTPPHGATGDLVQSEGLGRVCDATDTEAIEQTLETLYRDFVAGTLTPAISVSRYQKYDMRHLTHRLASSFDQLV